MNWLIIVASITLFAGIITGLLGLKSIRSKSYPQAEISWKQEPLSPWRYETFNMMILSIHSLGLISIAFILLMNLIMNVDTAFLPALEALDSTRFYSRIVGFLAMAFTMFMSGVLIAFHFLKQWIKPSSYAIDQNGLFYGGSHVPWSSFSHYEIGPDDGLISLYSGYSPSIRNWVLHPPAEAYASVLGLIQQNVPIDSPSLDDIPWKQSPVTFLVAMSALVLASVLPALWGLKQNQFWVWGYAFMAFFVVQDLGVRLITRFNIGLNKFNQQTLSA